MSAIGVFAVTAKAVLYCRNCGKRWESSVFQPERFGDEERACGPAFALGWRVYRAARGQLAYCPTHEPSRPMRQLMPTSPVSGTTEQTGAE